MQGIADADLPVAIDRFRAAEGAVLAIGLAEGFPGHGSRAPGECGWGMSRVGGHAARRVKEDER